MPLYAQHNSPPKKRSNQLKKMWSTCRAIHQVNNEKESPVPAHRSQVYRQRCHTLCCKAEKNCCRCEKLELAAASAFLFRQNFPRSPLIDSLPSIHPMNHCKNRISSARLHAKVKQCPRRWQRKDKLYKMWLDALMRKEEQLLFTRPKLTIMRLRMRAS